MHCSIVNVCYLNIIDYYYYYYYYLKLYIFGISDIDIVWCSATPTGLRQVEMVSYRRSSVVMVSFRNLRTMWHVSSMTAFCSVINKCDGSSITLRAWCSCFGITPVDERTIGTTTVFSIFQSLLISMDRSEYLESFSEIIF